jgi:hypothetical protein
MLLRIEVDVIESQKTPSIQYVFGQTLRVGLEMPKQPDYRDIAAYLGRKTTAGAGAIEAAETAGRRCRIASRGCDKWG